MALRMLVESEEALGIRGVLGVLVVVLGAGCSRPAQKAVDPVPVAIPGSTVATKEAAQAKALRFAVVQELERYRMDCGLYPTTEQGLAALFVRPPDASTMWRGPYIEGRPPILDPWGKEFRYRCDGGSYVLVSAGHDGLFETSDDIGGTP